MRALASVIVASLLCASSAGAGDGRVSDGFARVVGTTIVGPEGTPLHLKGINLGNWLVPEGYMFKFDSATSPHRIEDVIAQLVGPDEAAAFWKAFRASYVSRADIGCIRNLGFNSVRVPFNFRILTPEQQPGTWLEEGFALLDSVIAWSRAAGIYVVLDMHCAPGGQTGDNIDDSWGFPWLFESPAAQERTAEVWRKIAARYAQEPAILGYDLLNEPIPHFTDTARFNPRLEPLYRKIVTAVRTADTNHIVFLGGAQWNTNFDVFGPPFDARTAYTFHRYWTDTTQAVIKEFLDFRQKTRRPIWMGESGENNDAWVGGFRRLLERHDIGWCFWPYKKMDAPSCPLTFDRPRYWTEVVAFANRPRATFRELRQVRPPIEHVRQALRDFLDNCRLESCRINAGYVTALGLTPHPPGY